MVFVVLVVVIGIREVRVRILVEIRKVNERRIGERLLFGFILKDWLFEVILVNFCFL